MKKIAYILVLSLLLLNVGCQQTSDQTHAGYGEEEVGIENDSRTGAGVVDDSKVPGANGNGGTMSNTTSTGDTMHTPGAAGETEAASATEITQQQVGNTNSAGQENHSKSRTTKNKVIQSNNQ